MTNGTASMFTVPALRYTATFAAGVILAVAIVDSGQVQQGAFNEVTGLVGTMSDAGDIAPVDSTVIHKAAIAGTITLRRADPNLLKSAREAWPEEQKKAPARSFFESLWF